MRRSQARAKAFATVNSSKSVRVRDDVHSENFLDSNMNGPMANRHTVNESAVGG